MGANRGQTLANQYFANSQLMLDFCKTHECNALCRRLGLTQPTAEDVQAWLAKGETWRDMGDSLIAAGYGLFAQDFYHRSVRCGDAVAGQAAAWYRLAKVSYAVGNRTEALEAMERARDLSRGTSVD